MKSTPAPAAQVAPSEPILYEILALLKDYTYKTGLPASSACVLAKIEEIVSAALASRAPTSAIGYISQENLRAIKDGCSPVSIYSLDCKRDGDIAIFAAAGTPAIPPQSDAEKLKGGAK